MALKNCKECGNQVSTKADKCPICGAPVRNRKLRAPLIILVMLVAAAFVHYSDSGRDKTTAVIDQKPGLQDEKSETSDPHDKELAKELENQPVKSVGPANWMTGSVNDEMTDEARPYAATESLNSVEFKFPYQKDGGSKVTIVIRKERNEKVAYVMVDKGHMVFHTMTAVSS